MNKRHLMYSVLAATLVLGAVPPVSANPPSTNVAVTIHKPDGTPGGGARVRVFDVPFGDKNQVPGSSGIPLPVMADGTADGSGQFSTSLVTTMLDPSSLADLGTGQASAFNAIVLTQDRDGTVTVTDQIMNLGQDNAVAVDEGDQGVSQRGANVSFTPARIEATRGRAAPLLTCGIGGVCHSTMGYSYRYIRAVAYNSAGGMSTDLEYTYTSGTAKQTQATLAYSTNNTSWSVGSYFAEGASRDISRPWLKSGNYHTYVWASYKWRHEMYWVCDEYGYCTVWYEWQPWYFSGTVTDNNPDKNSAGTKIGVLSYSTPAFDTDPNHRTTLTTASPSLTRNQGQYHQYGFSLDVAGFLALTDKATYGSITYMKWTKTKSGCSTSRVLWGDGSDVQAIPIVQASCRQL